MVSLINCLRILKVCYTHLYNDKYVILIIKKKKFSFLNEVLILDIFLWCLVLVAMYHCTVGIESFQTFTYVVKKKIFASTVVQACRNPWAAVSKTI